MRETGVEKGNFTRMADEELQKTGNESLEEESDDETERAMQEMIAAAEARDAAEAAEAAAAQAIATAEPPPTRGTPVAEGDSSDDSLPRILSMRMPVIVKLAEKSMALSTVLKLNIGSVINFDKDAYQLVDLMANNSTIGLGQTVKIGENFGLRVIQIGPVEETIKSLGIAGASD
jgi:flagellar motor switch protein FliN/FliY